MSKTPVFSSPEFLQQHIRDILDFYQPRVFDPSGGFFQHFRDDGTIYDPNTRHLVSSTRFVFNYAMAERYFDDLDYKSWIIHGLDYLQQSHFQPHTGGYAWLRDQEKIIDATNYCYGLTFVMIAGATALLAGVEQGRGILEQAWKLMETHFWDSHYELYADEATADFTRVDPYRGQNANMHACEAMLWAFEATGNSRYFRRAVTLADHVTRRQAALANGLIWEHYDASWEIDWHYNRDNPKHLFRPWGFQSGHQTEWAKLLLILYRHQPVDWYLERARALFDTAIAQSWDPHYGGIRYGFTNEGVCCDDDKYFWVQAESFAAAALLAEATGEAVYRDWYHRIWDYSWQHLIDHEYGGWYRILRRDNRRYDNQKSPAGKVDYHSMGACYEVLRATQARPCR